MTRLIWFLCLARAVSAFQQLSRVETSPRYSTAVYPSFPLNKQSVRRQCWFQVRATRLWMIQSSPYTKGTKATFQDILDGPLQPLIDMSSQKSSSSKACFRRVPTSVVFWKEFKGRAQEFRSNLDHDFLSQIMDKPSLPLKGVHETGPEYMLLSKFLSLAGDIHNYIMDYAVDMNESSICGIELGTGLRVPDFVCTLKSEKDAYGLRKPIALIIVGEVKLKNLVNYGTSLEQLYETRAEVRDAIWQLAGYHVQFKCEFGILTTYKYTWASRLDSNGTLLLSPAYDSDQGGLDTTMNLLHYLSTLAAEKWKLGGWTAPVFLQVVSPESADEFEVDFSLSLLNDSSFNLVRVMNSHEDRVTWQAVDDKQSFYVIKGFESEGDRNLEVRCYEALSELQGYCIPVLLNKTFTLKADKVRKYALVLSWIGADEGNNYMTLPTHVLLRARDLVLKMHSLGVVHGDLRPENMNFDFKTNQLYIFDFSDAKLKAEMSAAAFKQACSEELESLDRQIEWSRSSSASQIVYFF